jgi:hypothetical protein
MSERIDLSLSPTGSNTAGTARITPELIAYHQARAHVLRGEALACWARGVWRWLTRRATAASIGDCGDRNWLETPARG